MAQNSVGSIEDLIALQIESNRAREQRITLLEAIGPLPAPRYTRRQRARRWVFAKTMDPRTAVARWIAPWLDEG